MSPSRDEVMHSRTRILASDDGLADKYRIRTGFGIGDEIVRVAHAGLGNAHT